MKYLLDFGKRECVPPIVARHGVMFEEPNSERKKYWLNENHVPLNLLKHFEEKKIARLLKRTNSGLLSDMVNSCNLKKRKRLKGLSHLLLKAEKLESQLCGYCNKDVLIRYDIIMTSYTCTHLIFFFFLKNLIYTCSHEQSMLLSIWRDPVIESNLQFWLVHI